MKHESIESVLMSYYMNYTLGTNVPSGQAIPLFKLGQLQAIKIHNLRPFKLASRAVPGLKCNGDTLTACGHIR